MEAINYEREVKRIYADADYKWVYNRERTHKTEWIIWNGLEYIGGYRNSPSKAWQSAYNNLVEQGKIKVNAKQSESL